MAKHISIEDIEAFDGYSSILPKNINEVEFGCPESLPPKSDSEKLALIRERLGSLIGMAAKNDSQDTLTICMWVLDVIDGKQ